MNFKKYRFVQPPGLSIAEKRVCFDKSNKFLFCCSGNIVKVFSISTTDCVQLLEHQSAVGSVHLNPHNFLQIITCTIEGVISVWDYQDGAKLKTFSINQAVNNFFVSTEKPLVVYAVLYDPEKIWSLYKITLLDNSEIQKQAVVKSVPAISKKVSVHFSGDYAAVVDRDRLMVKRTSGDGREFLHKLSELEHNSFVCVECHPSLECLATGESAGRIVLWYHFFKKQAVRSIYHWHSTEIGDIVFPKEGSSMYSSGRENVVVKWSIATSSKEETKEFLPRLKGNIKFLSVSPDNTFLAASLDDNSIVIASTQLEIVKNINSIVRLTWRQPCTEICGNFRYELLPLGLRFIDLKIDKNGANRRCLVTNGAPGRVQFFDLAEDIQILDLDVVNRNLPPAEPKEVPPYSDVIHLAFCQPWLATVDYRPDDHYSPDFTLKFWRYSDESLTFKLVCSIDHPHTQIITCMEFAPAVENDENLELVTTSLDGKVKVWTLLHDCSDAQNLKVTFDCDRTLSYRNLPANCCVFGGKGTVLAVGFGQTVAFYKFSDFRLLLSIQVVAEPNVIKKLFFGQNGETSKLLCVLSTRSLAVWDVDSQTPLWSRDMIVTTLCFDPILSMLAVFTPICIQFYRLTSSELIFERTFNESAICAACFDCTNECHQNTKQPKVYFFTTNQKLVCFCNKSDSMRSKQSTTNANYANVIETQLATILHGTKTAKRQTVDVDSRVVDLKGNLELLMAPAHTLPSLEILGLRFIESCLQPKIKTELNPEVGRKENVQMDVDESHVLEEIETSRAFQQAPIQSDFNDLCSYFSTL